MRVLDVGHQYALAQLDGDSEEILTFVKREGAGYPGNVGSHPGTNMQEVLRALMARTQYLNSQIRHDANRYVIECLRGSLYALEVRAAERHKRSSPPWSEDLEFMIPCSECGHIGCVSECRKAARIIR